MILHFKIYELILLLLNGDNGNGDGNDDHHNEDDNDDHVTQSKQKKISLITFLRYTLNC